jgi:hypothetical protein
MTKPRQPRYADIFAHDPAMFETAKQKWADAVSHLDENGWVTATRLAVADRYARAYAEYEALYLVAIVDGPVKVSPATGGEYFNYVWSAVEKLNERIAKFEAALKIPPVGVVADKLQEAPKTAADGYLGD